MTEMLDDHGTRLREIVGVGAVTALRLLGRTGIASQFESEQAFATFAGVEPIEIASGDHGRHRLSRAGDRRLNSAIHLIAVTQVRMRNSRGHGYFDKKIAAGETRNEAMPQSMTREPHLADDDRRRTTNRHHPPERRRPRRLTTTEEPWA